MSSPWGHICRDRPQIFQESMLRTGRAVGGRRARASQLSGVPLDPDPERGSFFCPKQDWACQPHVCLPDAVCSDSISKFAQTLTPLGCLVVGRDAVLNPGDWDTEGSPLSQPPFYISTLVFLAASLLEHNL